jgi:hypothetical protein
MHIYAILYIFAYVGSRKIAIKVPVDRYLSKYMEVKLGSHPFHLKRDSALSITIFGLLHPRTQRYMRCFTKDQPPEDHFVFTCSERQLDEFFNYSINEKNFFLVARMMKKQFYEDLFLFLESRKALAPVVTKNSIFDFLERYDISEDDLKYETVRRAVDRYFQKKTGEKYAQVVYHITP